MFKYKNISFALRATNNKRKVLAPIRYLLDQKLKRPVYLLFIGKHVG